MIYAPALYVSVLWHGELVPWSYEDRVLEKKEVSYVKIKGKVGWY